MRLNVHFPSSVLVALSLVLGAESSVLAEPSEAPPPANATNPANAAPVNAEVAAPVVSPSAQPSDDKSVKVDVGAGTIFPLSFSVVGTVELPYRILLQGDVGFMPSAYSNTIANLLDVFGADEPFGGDLIKAGLKSSFVGRLSAGFRPFPKLGLELLFGYSLVTGGGSETYQRLVNNYLARHGSGLRIPQTVSFTIPLHTTMHSFHASVGWRFLLLDDHLVLRASLGYLQCLGSTSGIEVTSTGSLDQAALDKVNSVLSSDLDGYYSTYVKVPIVSLTAAYRF